jgi:formylmethanofuran dehydrogenase subunit C
MGLDDSFGSADIRKEVETAYDDEPVHSYEEQQDLVEWDTVEQLEDIYANWQDLDDDQHVYEIAAGWAEALRFSEEDLYAFCSATDLDEDDGTFISAFANVLDADRVKIPDMSDVNRVGSQNDAHLVVEGDVGHEAGKDMQEGLLEIHGDAGGKLGESMDGGEIRVEGDVGSVGRYRADGTAIYAGGEIGINFAHSNGSGAVYAISDGDMVEAYPDNELGRRMVEERYDEWLERDRRGYTTAREGVDDIPIDAETVRWFCEEHDLAGRDGFFVTALMRESSESRFRLPPLEEVDFVGLENYWNSITIEGDVGSHLGAGMKDGSISVEGDAGAYAGYRIREDSLTRNAMIEIEGHAGRGLGTGMQGGRVEARSADEGVGTNMGGGEIYLGGGIRAGDGMTGGTVVHKDRELFETVAPPRYKRIAWKLSDLMPGSGEGED